MADRHWVGGTATWDGTAGSKWATTNGGAGGAAVPTRSDDVYFDTGSNTGSPITVTLSASSVCRSIDCTGFTRTISHPASTDFIVGDNGGTARSDNVMLKFVSGMTYTRGSATTSRIIFSSTYTTNPQTIDSGTRTLGNINFSTGGSYQLSSSFTTTATATMQLDLGTLDTNGQAISCGIFNSNNSNTRTLTLGASAITLTGASTTVWNLATSTGITFTPGTSTISCATASPTFAGGGLTYNNLTITSTGALTLNQANTFNNLKFTPVAGGVLAAVLGNDQTVTGTFTSTGLASGSIDGRVSITPANVISSGSVTRTITAAAVSLTKTDFADITAAGAAIPFTGTKIGDAGGNTNITADVARTLYWIGGTGNTNATNRYSLSTGGASATTTPLPQDSLIMDGASFGGAGLTVTLNLRYWCGNLDASAVTNSPTITNGGFNGAINGNLTLGNTLTLSGSVNFSLTGRGSQTITTGGNSLTAGLTINAATGTYTLQDNLTTSGTLTVTGGTLVASSRTINATTFSSTGSVTRAFNFTNGTLNCTGTGTVWTTTTTLVVTSTGSTVNITDTSATGKTLQPGSNTWNNVNITGGNNATFTWATGGGQSLICGNLTIGANLTMTWSTGNSYTITNMTLAGTAGNNIISNSAIGGTQATLTISGTTSVQYAQVQDMNVVGNQVFAVNSKNLGNNTNWVFVRPVGARSATGLRSVASTRSSASTRNVVGS